MLETALTYSRRLMYSPQFMPSSIESGECISNAWNMLKNNYGMYLGVSIVAYLMIACVPCVNVFIMGPIMGGVYHVILRDMRGEPVDFGMMFKGFEKFLPLMVIGLIQSIPGIIAQILQYVFQFSSSFLDAQRGGGSSTFFQSSGNGLAVGGGVMILLIVGGLAFMIFSFVWWAVFFFAVPLVMEYDMRPVDAIKLSASAAFSNLGGLLGLIIFEALIVLLGVLLICIGMFLISIPVMFLANAFAYRMVFPWTGQQFNTAPPPPGAYGTGYGSGM